MEFRTQIGKSGRIVVPVRLHRALGLQPGDEIVLRLENDAIRIIPLLQAVKMAQNTLRQCVPEGDDLVDALLRARREEAARE